jgi:glycosyltransferase involved in cell wall biosynthesis
VRIVLATDAWAPQVNGVVRTLNELIRELGRLGHKASVIHPGLFRSIPCPFYKEIRLAIGARGKIGPMIEAAKPDALHIVTEGPVGAAARHWSLENGFGFTSAYHTRFPEYLAERHMAPKALTYALLRRFHAPSEGVMVATPSVARALEARGFVNLRPWTRGVDRRLFDAGRRRDLGLPRPIFLCVGRVAKEKNLPAFLKLDLPGSKAVVGDGPALKTMKRRFPDVHFLGYRENGDLAQIYASADVFVFPSRTDTFGLVMIEALASGLPVAAYPVAGPFDVIGTSGAGVLDENLRAAALAALNIPRERCRAYAQSFEWSTCAQQFVEHLAPRPPAARSVAL